MSILSGVMTGGVVRWFTVTFKTSPRGRTHKFTRAYVPRLTDVANHELARKAVLDDYPSAVNITFASMTDASHLGVIYPNLQE